ncbi:RNA-binding protein 4.1-like isoform X2 [Microplitis mediator]|uniref:RNA-binding protein 4.1-like isoform X2 n=1 Tax=Microplitis mediator TaxID=375433 RepID=UPI0025533BE0|nr:RNA-binding protein 4.1-like isoform X2 [Microplitis mediator]
MKVFNKLNQRLLDHRVVHQALIMVSSNLPRKTKIFVGRLPENCRNDELRQLFLRFGEVTECDVMNRYGFVHMAREEDAAAAIKALHNTNFKGATINVEQSTGKSRGTGPIGRRDDRRGGPMRGGRSGRDGGRDSRPGPYNHRGALPLPRAGYNGSATGGVGGGYADYGNRSSSDFGGRSGDYSSGGYADRANYGQNVGGGGMGGYASTPGIVGGYGPNTGAVGYGPGGAGDYGRTNDYGRTGDFGTRSDYGNFQTGGAMSGDFNRGMPGIGDYGRADNFGRATDPYTPRNDYDRNTGPMRNGGAIATGGYGSGPLSGGQSYASGNPSYNTGPGPQTDMFSRRPVNAVTSGVYPPISGGYTEAYDRPDSYGPPRNTGNRFPGPADSMPPRY